MCKPCGTTSPIYVHLTPAHPAPIHHHAIYICTNKHPWEWTSPHPSTLVHPLLTTPHLIQQGIRKGGLRMGIRMQTDNPCRRGRRLRVRGVGRMRRKMRMEVYSLRVIWAPVGFKLSTYSHFTSLFILPRSVYLFPHSTTSYSFANPLCLLDISSFLQHCPFVVMLFVMAPCITIFLLQYYF